MFATSAMHFDHLWWPSCLRLYSPASALVNLYTMHMRNMPSARGTDYGYLGEPTNHQKDISLASGVCLLYHTALA